MRHFALVALMFAIAGCATSDGIPILRANCEDRYDAVWVAAQSAVGRLGGSVVNADRASGAILGRLDADVLGAEINLHINLRRLPDHNPGTQQPVTVTIKATESRVTDPDAHRIEELRSLEDRYLRLVGERAACGGPF